MEEGTNVEASTAYAEAFEQEATRLGHADKVQIYMEDFVEIALEIPKADIVTLDRVVCCYHGSYDTRICVPTLEVVR